MSDPSVKITPQSCKDRAYRHLQAMAVGDPDTRAILDDPERVTLLLLGVQLGVTTVFEAMTEAAEGQS